MKLRRGVLVGVVLVLLGIIVYQLQPRPEEVSLDLPNNGQPGQVSSASLKDIPKDAGHPRLFFTQKEISRLQKMASTTHQEIWKPVIGYVRAAEGTSPPKTPPRKGDLDTYRNFGNQLIPYAFACVVTEKTSTCKMAKDYLLTYAQWDQWSNDNERSLGMAHMVLGNALAYDWLYERLSDKERQLVSESLGGWADKLYEASREEKIGEWNNWWTDAFVQNHYYTIHSALGMAGLALIEEDKRAENWLRQAVDKLETGKIFLESIQDGSWHEGLSYQGYMLTLSLPFWVNLRAQTGIDLIPHTYLSSYPYWRIMNYLPGTTQFIMAYGTLDWNHSQYRPQNILRFAAAEYRDGYAEWMAQQHIQADGRWENHWSAPWYVFEFLYYNPRIKPIPPDDLPQVHVFSDLEGVIWRTGWDKEDLVFGMKTGAYGGRFAYDTFTQAKKPWNMPCVKTDCKLSFGHNHDDANGFYMYQNGAWLAQENEGVANNETEFHNTLLIDGKGQLRPPLDDQKDPKAMSDLDGFLSDTAHTDGFNYAAANATNRYAQVSDLDEFTRYVLFIRPGYFIMMDNIAAGKEHRYEWVAHFGKHVSVKDDWVRGEAGSGQILGVQVIAPDKFKASPGDNGTPYVRIRPLSPSKSTRLIHLLYPTNEAQWKERPDATLVDDTGKAVHIQVEFEDHTDDILLRYSRPGSKADFDHYLFDGQAAAVIRDEDGDLQQVFFYGGTRLRDKDLKADLIRTRGKSGPVEVFYNGNEVSINGEITNDMTVYAPDAKVVEVNGVTWKFSRSGDYVTVSDTQNRSSMLSNSASYSVRR